MLKPPSTLPRHVRTMAFLAALAGLAFWVAPGSAQRKDASTTALGNRLRTALNDPRRLEALLRETISAGEDRVKSLKRLIDSQGEKQLKSYLKQFFEDIEKAPKITRAAVVANSKKLSRRRTPLLRLGRGSFKLRDALAPADQPMPKANADGVQDKTEKPPRTFDELLRREEEKQIQAWKTGRGFGRVTSLETSVLSALNQIRAANNQPALTVDDNLRLAAREHSNDMVKRGFFSHNSPVAGRRSYSDRAARYGTRCSAENIGKGQSPQLVVQLWMKSGAHRRNILDPRHTTIGVGIVGNKYTTMFGAKAVQAKAPGKIRK